MEHNECLNKLKELRDTFDPDSDEYADISQTIYYFEEVGDSPWE